MARPGQNALRKRKAAEAALQTPEARAVNPPAASDGGDDSSEEQVTTYAQVLPVAVLDEDWDGEILDGATYLGVANRENAKLPAFKRVDNPYRVMEEQDPQSAAQSSTQSYDQPNGDPGPSILRHPALPKESWEMLFPIHFVKYKKYILADWPPSPLPPYPSDYPRIPNVRDRLDLMYFINGYPRARIRLAEKSEEEMMNLAARPRANGTAKEGVPGASGTGDRSAYGKEPEGPRHRKRDPTVAILARLSTSDVLAALSRITKVIAFSLDHVSSSLQLPTLPEQYTNLLPTQPQSPDPSASPSSSPPSSERQLLPDSDSLQPNGPSTTPHYPIPNPLSSHVSRWIFALLLIVDEHLPGNDLSTLRELARLVMRIAAWRWIHGVNTGEVEEGHVIGEKRKSGKGAHAQTGSSSKQWLFDGSCASGPGALDQDEDETSVDSVLSRCWLIVYAVAHGWGQKDLLDDLKEMFA